MKLQTATSVVRRCHIIGKYRAHNACNLKLRIYSDKNKVPVVLHNIRDYHGHLIMSALGVSEAVKNQTISCIPNMTFSRLQFIDSFQFVNSSLDRLSANLQTEDLVMTSRGVSDSELALLRRKGVVRRNRQQGRVFLLSLWPA